jgi:signal transduction histidine kinase
MRFIEASTAIVLVIISLQAAAIVALLVQRARGRAAVSALFHDIRQPLNAILMNANACLRWLDRPEPDLAEVRAALTDVVDAGQRADQIMRRSRELLSDQPPPAAKPD